MSGLLLHQSPGGGAATPLGVYVVGQSKDLQRAQRVMACVRARGHRVTFDWAAEVLSVGTASPPGEQRRASALRDMRGVLEADLLVFLHPAVDVVSTGCWWELGFWTALWYERCVGDEVAMTQELARRTLFLPNGLRAYGSRANPGPCIFDTLADLVVAPVRTDEEAVEAFLRGREQTTHLKAPPAPRVGSRTPQEIAHNLDTDRHERLHAALGIVGRRMSWPALMERVDTLRQFEREAKIDVADALGIPAWISAEASSWEGLVARVRALRELHTAVMTTARRVTRLDAAADDVHAYLQQVDDDNSDDNDDNNDDELEPAAEPDEMHRPMGRREPVDASTHAKAIALLHGLAQHYNVLGERSTAETLLASVQALRNLPQEEKAGQVAPAPLSPPEAAPALGGLDVAVEAPSVARPQAGRYNDEQLAAINLRMQALDNTIDQLRTRVRGLELALAAFEPAPRGKG